MPGRLDVVMRSFCALLAAAGASLGAAVSDDAPVSAQAAEPRAVPREEAGEVREDNGLAMKLVWCPAGFVTMDNILRDLDEQLEVDETNNDKTSPVKAFLSRGFWLGKFEVTQAEWKEVMRTEPWKDKSTIKEGDDFPVTYVDWNDVTEFCRLLTRRERAAGRLPADWEFTLPTEAQWERACRARTETRFSFGDDPSALADHAWTYDNTVDRGEDYAHAVGRKKPNAWGLHDMHGNVWEWCRDAYVEALPGGRDPEVARAGADRVMRGGGIYRRAAGCLSSFRNKHAPDWKLFDLGFRVALVRVQP